MALRYAWFDSYDSVGYVLTLHIFPPCRALSQLTLKTGYHFDVFVTHTNPHFQFPTFHV